jgi:hypothetical protein
MRTDISATLLRDAAAVTCYCHAAELALFTGPRSVASIVGFLSGRQQW